MTTALLLVATVLASPVACETHDSLVQTALAQAHHPHVLAQTSTTSNKETTPPTPAKPAPKSPGKDRGQRPARPEYLFL